MGEKMVNEKRKRQKEIDHRRMYNEGKRINGQSIKNFCQYCGRPLQYCVCAQW